MSCFILTTLLLTFYACDFSSMSSQSPTNSQQATSNNQSKQEATTTTTTIKEKEAQSNTSFSAKLSVDANSNASQKTKTVTTSTTTTPPVSNQAQVDGKQYAWSTNYQNEHALANRISPPKAYERKATEKHTFLHWLRHLPLKSGKPAVYLYNGAKKGNQQAHYAVLDIDVGKRDLQQCADAVMRLRAEYLLSNKRHNDIQFNFTSGDAAKYSQWKQGYRPVIKGNNVRWTKQKALSNSYASFKQYMQQVFNYAGTFSLSKELKPVSNLADIQAGDVFIQGGFPGHAVIVVDVAIHEATGDKAFLLAQSYMPAQDIHILNNPNSWTGSPWYKVSGIQNTLQTPEWTFNVADLKRF